ncbi:MAG: MarR family transcriptional regulator [Pyrodictiaceae archaeon]
MKGGVYSVEELAEKLRLSKATANRSLNKLVELGLVARRREKRQGVGRPRYKYYIDNPKSIIERIKLDLKECSSRYSEKLDELFSIIIKSKSK